MTCWCRVAVCAGRYPGRQVMETRTWKSYPGPEVAPAREGSRCQPRAPGRLGVGARVSRPLKGWPTPRPFLTEMGVRPRTGRADPCPHSFPEAATSQAHAQPGLCRPCFDGSKPRGKHRPLLPRGQAQPQPPPGEGPQPGHPGAAGGLLERATLFQMLHGGARFQKALEGPGDVTRKRKQSCD